MKLKEKLHKNRVIVRSAGEMASGVIRRIFLAGFEVIALEKAEPDCIRQAVCFASAIYSSQISVDGVTARLAESEEQALTILKENSVPVIINPEGNSIKTFKPYIVVDARMLKAQNDSRLDLAPVVIGLGPGFEAGINCHAIIETNRGIDLGRVIYDGKPQEYTGTPASVAGISKKRVLYSPAEGVLKTEHSIGDLVKSGDTICSVGNNPVKARIDGVVRGLIRNGFYVSKNMKIGDIDPRALKENCYKISDKANAIAGGVLEAIFVLRDNRN